MPTTKSRSHLFLTVRFSQCLVIFATVYLPALCMDSVENKEHVRQGPERPSGAHAFMTSSMLDRIPLNRCGKSPGRITENYTLCGDGLCRCRGLTADCSHSESAIPRLGYVPRLPSDIRHFVFTYFVRWSIHNEDFFLNITNITLLDIGMSGLDFMAPGAVQPLKHLKHLSLYSNNYNITTLAPFMSLDTLEFLDLSHNDFDQIPDRFFDGHFPRLKTLCLRYNYIHSINMVVFVPLTSLTYLDLSHNQITNKFLSSAFLPQITDFFSLKSNSLETFIETCNGTDSLFPNLTKLSLKMNRLKMINSEFQVCLPSLAYLDVSGNRLKVIFASMFNPHRFPSLTHLDLSRMQPTMVTIITIGFANPMISFINLRNDHINFWSDMSRDVTFQGCPNLLELQLDGNDFDMISKHKFKQLFRYNMRLTTLSIQSSHLCHVSADMFEGLVFLRTLRLSYNKLTTIPDGTFDVLPALTRLELSSNMIPMIKEGTFSITTRRHLAYIDLSGNPFTCSCDLRWFQRWLRKKTSSFNVSLSYKCHNIVDMEVKSFHVTDQSCLLSEEVSRSIIITVAMLIVSMTMLLLFYRYRWHLRLVLYEVFRGRGDRWRRLQHQYFEYDVFVSYDSEDFHWVRQHLIPKLEEGMGLRLCIHERDFTPGKFITENITDCVQASRKVMMLFSANFATSPWCQFELNLCLGHVLENDDTLLVVFLHDVPTRDMTSAMMAVMKTTTYIGWGDEPEAQAAFWGRVRLALT